MRDTHLYEEPRRDERQTAVLPVKSIMVRVEGEVVQVEKSETETRIISLDILSREIIGSTHESTYFDAKGAATHITDRGDTVTQR